MKWLSDAEIAEAVRCIEQQRAGAAQPLPAACFVIETPAEAAQLLAVLNRACSTWEPRYWPTWLPGWFERLERMT